MKRKEVRRIGVRRKGVGRKGVGRKRVGRKRVGGVDRKRRGVDRKRRDGWKGKGGRGGQEKGGHEREVWTGKGGDKRGSYLENLVELGLVQELRMTSLHTLKLNGNLLPVGDVYT